MDWIRRVREVRNPSYVQTKDQKGHGAPKVCRLTKFLSFDSNGTVSCFTSYSTIFLLLGEKSPFQYTITPKTSLFLHYFLCSFFCTFSFNHPSIYPFFLLQPFKLKYYFSSLIRFYSFLLLLLFFLLHCSKGSFWFENLRPFIVIFL